MQVIYSISRNYHILFGLVLVFYVHSAFSSQVSSPFKDSRASSVYFLKPIFDILDCTSEGVVDPAEVDEHFHPLFFSNDRDRSRSISEREFIQFTPDKNKYRFIYSLIDKNKDGEVSPREFRDYLIFVIDDTDVDNNGEVSKAEVGIASVARRPTNFNSVLRKNRL